VKSALTFPATFVKMNWAAVAGLYYYATGRKGLWPAGDVHRHRHRR
jgi:hypothetical protein